MRLIYKQNDDCQCDLIVEQLDQDIINRNLKDAVKELREIEEKFYKVFDLNPCPMALADYYTHKIFDVNDAFVKLMELDKKETIIDKESSDKEINIINKDIRDNMYRVLEKGETFKNIFIPIRTFTGKKLSGLFSGSVVELNGNKYILTICQVINRKCFYNFFKHFLKTLL